MTLKEKFAYMATGKPYNDLDPLLIEARNKATEDTNKLNAENDPAKKEELIRKLFGSAGKTPFVNPNFRCEFGQNIHVGDNFYANYDCVILDGAPVTIGDDVLLAPKVGMYTSNHLFDAKERKLGGCIAKPIRIGNRCWIGACVSITHGVTIGDNTIIGAGSVVTHDIPANVIAAGVPAKVIRPITEKDKTGFDPNDPRFL
ncbi:sugar O-acetyltransferase [Lactobacillus amylovorus subsp. animalium]|jgi:acetyltransferase-like isoleucine patch superfamily enzyme|uniref:Acetyltransferase n=1 Tax=Lactobacillus amylovorus TaxID=1604 RepID=A0A9X4AE58_LACAM|nr:MULTISPECIES: sugar O-acetyltransferase [Lactobacillus]MDB6224168.1 sugar O-acetyltransferase [Lactobacillus amylovorus]MDB6234603.1 sugar O-acetyltransferase [Lactobacillus amylovorus]MDB6250439.1 sugar O-acetyltransferase [Lactobacillus amylovorus]MDB6262696.1 sugar O-acetyltransferase [Lactobacillus amylovorus]NME29913.1 sugar O-acetyltransferase [Lactobacillus amylovorus]